MGTKLNKAQLAYIEQEAKNAASLVMDSDLESLIALFEGEASRNGAAMAVMIVAGALNWTAKHTAVAIAYAVMRQMRAVQESAHLGDDDSIVNFFIRSGS